MCESVAMGMLTLEWRKSDERTIPCLSVSAKHNGSVSMTMGNLKSQMFCEGTAVCKCSLHYAISGVQTCTCASKADLSSCLQL